MLASCCSSALRAALACGASAAATHAVARRGSGTHHPAWRSSLGALGAALNSGAEARAGYAAGSGPPSSEELAEFRDNVSVRCRFFWID